MVPTFVQLEQQPHGPTARGPCCIGTKLLLMRRDPLTRQLRDLPPGAAGWGPCRQGSRVGVGTAVLGPGAAGVSVMVISGEVGLEAAGMGGLFSTSGLTPGLCRFMWSFRMWWTTAAALKACWGDTRPISDRFHPRRPPAFPLPRGLLKPTCTPLISRKGPGSSRVCWENPKESPPPQLPQPSLQGPDGPLASWRGQLTLHLLLAKFFWIWRLTDG